MKKAPLLLSVLLMTFFCMACHKEFGGFTGKEKDNQAFNKCLRLSAKKQFQDAIDCLEIFKNRFPESKMAFDAELRIADAYYLKRDYLLAAETYQLYTKLHPTSDKLDYAYYRIGLSYLNDTPKAIDRDQEYLPEAIDSLAIVLSQYPNSPYYKMARFKYDQSRRMLARRDLYVGKLYYKWGEYKAAIPRFQEVFEKYPSLGYDEESLSYVAISYKKLGDLDSAKKVAEILKEKFPNGKTTHDVLKEVGSH